LQLKKVNFFQKLAKGDAELKCNNDSRWGGKNWEAEKKARCPL